MLPTAEGGKANAWLRQKNAGIYVRPRLFSPYVEEAKVRVIFRPHRKWQSICVPSSYHHRRADVLRGQANKLRALGQFVDVVTAQIC